LEDIPEAENKILRQTCRGEDRSVKR